MYAPIRTAAPSVQPVALAEIKRHCVVETDNETPEAAADIEATLQELLDAAVSLVDGYSGLLGRCMIDQNWMIRFDRWAPALELPFPDVSAATISYIDADGATQMVGAADFELLPSAGGTLCIFRRDFAFPSLDSGAVAPVMIDFTAGFGATAGDVPPAIRVALVRQVGYWWETATGEPGRDSLATSVMQALKPFRWVTP